MRVGEASHPGPGGKAAHRRKQWGFPKPITKGDVRKICLDIIQTLVRDWAASAGPVPPTGPRASSSDDWWGHGASTWHDGGDQWDSAGTAAGRYGSWSWRDWWDYKQEPMTLQDYTTEDWTEEPAQSTRHVSLASGWRSEGGEAWDAPAELTPPNGSTGEGPKKRWRRSRGNTHRDDDRQADQDAEQHSWKLKRDVWQARAPLAFIETAKDMSELLDSAAGVSILAWTSSAEVAHELWDLFAGERADADGADVSLTLLYEASSEAPWFFDGASDVTILPVPGNVLGKLQHKKFHMVTDHGDPPNPGRLWLRQAWRLPTLRPHARP